MKVQCQVCFEFIAIINPSFLSFPMTGAMFKSIDPHHGWPDPFDSSLGWENFRCPYGQHRPMFKDDEIMTDAGLITLPRDGTHVPMAAQGVQGPLPEADAASRHQIAKEVYDEERVIAIKREDLSTERTVKKRELIKEVVAKAGKKKTGFACETCGKEFDKEINMSRHKSMAHRGAL